MNIDFDKSTDGLVPAIIQDDGTQRVLMLGYMDREAFEQTKSSGRVVFYSRSRERLWTKGETRGNFLMVKKVIADCDADTILIKADPTGPVCHTGADTCFCEDNEHADFLFRLEEIIKDRQANPVEGSHTSKLFSKGLNKIAQKVGEEAVELIIESKDSDDERFNSEAADLFYHLLVLFAERNIELANVLETLRQRHINSVEKAAK